MTVGLDFERTWLSKFAACLEEVVGEGVRQAVMAGSEGLSDQSDREEVIAWSQAAMERLEALVADEGQRRAIMTGCACQYPKAGLQAARETYAATRDLARVHGMLQAQFETFLRHTLHLPEEMVDDVVSRGWGLAGVLQDDRVLATKIPKSGFLVQYLEETDPDARRQVYCHCPRVRDALKRGQSLPRTYCYCGAGFYQAIWEEILQRPVEVEVLESVLDGGEVCTIAIHLPQTGE
jgi:hypothetical protein